MTRQSLLSYLEDFSRHAGVCFVFDDGFRRRRYSYREISSAVDRLAARLQRQGMGREDRVLFWCENRPEWVTAFWACLKLGAIAVPIDYRSSADFVARIQKIVSAKLLLVGEETPPLQLGIPVWKLVFDEGLCTTEGAAQLSEGPVSPAAVAEIVFTSGTTGEPKGVVITHQNLLANLVPVEQEIDKYRRCARLVGPLRFLDLLPLSHMFGQVLAAFIPQLLGGVVVFQKTYNPRDTISLIRRERVSVMVCVPKLLAVMKEHVLREFPETAAAHSSLSLPVYSRWWKYRRVHGRFGFKFWSFAVGAAPLDPEVENFWSGLGFLTMQGYGLTEAAPIVTINHPFEARRGSLGKPLPGLQVRIAEDGEILVRGANVTPGYYNAPQETAKVFHQGWLHTGDIGEMDAEGRLYYRGRKKEMIVRPDGLNVFPEDVEKVVNGVEGVRESAVVGVLRDGEERVHAVVILDRDRDLAEIQRLANERLEEHQRIRSISLWPGEAFPRTEGTHKLKRREIRAWEVERQRPQPLSTRSQTLEDLLAHFSGRAREEVRESTRLSEDLGLSSLERVQLVGALEEHFQVSLDDQLFSQAREVGDLKRILSGSAAAGAKTDSALKFPAWSLSWWSTLMRRLAVLLVVVPLTLRVARLKVKGQEHLPKTATPILLAANHQSHLDTPVIFCALPGRMRMRLAPAMRMEFFNAHFRPQEIALRERLLSSLQYGAACLVFQAFPLPQREPGVRQALRYMGKLVEKGNSILLFPEGHRSEEGSVGAFQPGVGLMAASLKIPVIPVRVEGTPQILPVGVSGLPFMRALLALLKGIVYKPRKEVHITFGEPLDYRGEGYVEFAARVEAAVRRLPWLCA